MLRQKNRSSNSTAHRNQGVQRGTFCQNRNQMPSEGCPVVVEKWRHLLRAVGSLTDWNAFKRLGRAFGFVNQVARRARARRSHRRAEEEGMVEHRASIADRPVQNGNDAAAKTRILFTGDVHRALFRDSYPTACHPAVPPTAQTARKYRVHLDAARFPLVCRASTRKADHRALFTPTLSSAMCAGCHPGAAGPDSASQQQVDRLNGR